MNSTAKQIASRRVHVLFQQATATHETDPERAATYLSTAKKIAMSARMRLPAGYKRRICKGCNTLLVPGETSRVRLQPRREPHLVITCLKCNRQTRLPLKKIRKTKENPKIEQNNK